MIMHMNRYVKRELQKNDTGCSLCGKKNKSLKYFMTETKQYCKQKCYDIALSDAIVLRIDYH